MTRKFLTARWANLILANYAVPAELLAPHLPPGVELDASGGRAYCSLVGFQFLDTRVLGIPWPGFRHFPEWNLRFYVRHNGLRGVCFVREFVPQRLVATVARLIYNEPYRAAALRQRIAETDASLTAEYEVDWAGRTHRLRATGGKPAVVPASDGFEHFFKEHSWGFGTSRRGKLIRYEVSHPEWAVYPVTECEVEVDWGMLYGPEWAGFSGRKPDSVVLTAGSAVSVYPHGTAG